jgi:phage gpG-like protein
MTIGLEINTEGIEAYSANAASDVPEALQAGVMDAAEFTAGTIRRWIADTFGKKGNKVTGNLANSYTVQLVKTEKGDIKAGVFSDLEYAAIQNYGGTFGPKTAGALTVPIGMGKELPVGARARDVPGLVMIKQPGKPPLLVKPRKTRWDLYFVLVKQVTIPATYYLEKAEADAERDVIEILKEAAQKGADKAER